MAGQAERASQPRGQDRGPVTHRHDPAWRCALARRYHGVDRARLLMEPDRNGPIPPRIVQPVAPIAREDETDPELPGRLAKGSDLIPRGRRHQENAFTFGLGHFHTLNLLSSFHFLLSTCQVHKVSIGSAQQYHGSLA